MPEQITVTVADIEAALRLWLADFEYDLHKSLECHEETGKDTYAEQAAEFFGYLPTDAAPPAPADRAAVLREAADVMDEHCEKYGVLGVGDRLRRMADEAQQGGTP